MAKAAIEKAKVLEAAIRKATPPTMIRVDERLYLALGKTGAQSWLFRFQLNGRRRDMGLGSYPERTLANARDDALAARRLVERGIDPIDDRRAQEAAQRASATTFDDFAADYAATQSWSAAHAAAWAKSIELYASPVIGKLALDAITTGHVLEILSPLWTSKHETAIRLRGRIEAVLDAAKVRGLRTGENPGRWRGHLSHTLQKSKQVRRVNPVRHHPALPSSDVPAFWRALSGKTTATAGALRLVILTACRTGEVLGAEWSEIDLGEKLWTIPATRMKAGQVHRVPLSEPAVAILQAQQGAHPRFVFPGRDRTEPLNVSALRVALRRIRGDITVHGFRSSFRDWASEETHYPREVCEQALAHAIGSAVEAAYRRTDLLEKRRALMTDWAAFVTTKPASNVVKLPKAAGGA